MRIKVLLILSLLYICRISLCFEKECVFAETEQLPAISDCCTSGQPW